MTEQAVQDIQIAKTENIVQEKTQPVVESKKEEIKKEAEASQESVQDVNWRKFRENREIERKKAEADAIAREKAEKEAQALKAALEVALNKQTNHQQQYQQEEVEETEQQRIDRLVIESINKRDAVIEQKRREHEAKTFPQRLRNDYKDFDQICTGENLDYLEYKYPEVASTLSMLEDGYDKWSRAYQIVKKLVPNPDSKKDQMKAENNQKKPQSMSSPTMTPMGKPSNNQNDVEQRRAENWARMQKQMKGLN